VNQTKKTWAMQLSLKQQEEIWHQLPILVFD
jgi:hypothetical protein